jgi:hypothetical protein
VADADPAAAAPPRPFSREAPMPLHLYPDVHSSGSVPAGWAPSQGGTIKYPVRNARLLQYLRQLLPGRWQKVIKKGSPGEIHYFEHASGQVADVKYFP